MKVGVYDLSSIIFIRTVTPLHIGVGRVTGVVDLPIQRDGLGFPCIPSSSLKGALRAFFRERIGDYCTEVLFGASPEAVESYAGAFAVNEAFLLAIPTRSLRGIWTLVTSPFLLNRFKGVLEMVGAEKLKSEIDDVMSHIDKIGKEQILMVDPEEFSINGEVILNEEFRLKPQQLKELEKLARAVYPEDTKRFAVVHDDIIKGVIERSILRRTRIKLEKFTKRVETGGLWTEEEVPINTIFFTWFLYSRSRRRIEEEKKKEWERNSGIKEYVRIGEHDYATSKAVMNCVELKLLKEARGIIIFGGHETIGRGVVQLLKIGDSSCH